jgi:hypothetical protein
MLLLLASIEEHILTQQHQQSLLDDLVDIADERKKKTNESEESQ